MDADTLAREALGLDAKATPGRCETCDRPLPTPEQWAHTRDCDEPDCPEGAECCWGDWGNCEPVDWRGRALAAEAELARVRSTSAPPDDWHAAVNAKAAAERIAREEGPT